LRENLLGECYEVLEVLDEGDTGKLSEELGDLLMQIVFHVQIATEAGDFKLGDVIEGINEKLIYRHPHIFGSERVSDAEEVARNWEQLKSAERDADASVLDSVPRHMPALAYSQEIQRRVAQVGFDWEDKQGIIDKLVEEVEEYRRAGNAEEKAAEFGDVLFTLVNIARREGINSETALREASRRFFRRFTGMEGLCRRRGLIFSKLTFDEKNALWEEVKRQANE